tara:strand:- start:1084 stop:1377 length:294 start_codon:yes stop_codon:yes gene_type:complete
MSQSTINNLRPKEIDTEWPNFITTPTTTATTRSNSPEYNDNLILRIQNLELLVSNLSYRIVELEQNKNNISDTTTYNWSNETKKYLNLYHLLVKKFN